MDAQTKIINEIENLCRKADQTRSMHSLMRDKTALVNRGFLLFVTIGSAIGAMLIFASVPASYQTWIGIFLALIFIASLIPGALNFDLKIFERMTAVQAWGDWVRDAKNFCNVEIAQMDSAAAALKQRELIARYKKVMEDTPLIPDSKFNKYKRLHLQKVEISKSLDKNPFKTIREIKKGLKNGDGSLV